MTSTRTPTRSALDAAPRDQQESAFASLLADLVLSLPGSRAAVLVDAGGEAVDYAGVLDPFELKVIAAHLQIVIARLELREPWAPVRQLVLSTARRLFLVRAIESEYVLVVVLRPFAARSATSRALDVAHARIRAEAGWSSTGSFPTWYRASVLGEDAEPRRPAKMRVAGEWEQLVILGTLVALAPGDRGFRVRLSRGAEICLVRERFGAWYADTRLGN
jgi:hypothetical protein